MQILIEDNFFDSNSLEKLRKFGLSFDYISSQQMEEKMGSDRGWKGYRTRKLTSYDKFFLYNCQEKIFKKVGEFFDCKKLQITSYFHLTFEDTKKITTYIRDKYHRDTDCVYAGIVYMTPNPQLNAGTSILDEENNKIVDIDNVYNRLVSYPGNYFHAISDTFGTTKEDARMTLTFFVHEKYMTLDRGNPDIFY